MLRAIESKIESLFEGVFGRAFRSNVQPVELARRLVKEMDDHKSVSVSRVYVPNEYTVFLSPGDRKQFADYEDQLREELQEYLAEHARRERYVLLTPPRVKLESDDDLGIGLFGIATRLVRGNRPPADAPPEEPKAGMTMVYQAVPADDHVAAPVRSAAALLVGAQRHPLSARTTVLGRSKDAGIQIPDPNVSRRHAEIRFEDGIYTIVDLDSTNGIELNGKRVKELVLDDGMSFTLGSTEIAFVRETS